MIKDKSGVEDNMCLSASWATQTDLTHLTEVLLKTGQGYDIQGHLQITISQTKARHSLIKKQKH